MRQCWIHHRTLKVLLPIFASHGVSDEEVKRVVDRCFQESTVGMETVKALSKDRMKFLSSFARVTGDAGKQLLLMLLRKDIQVAICRHSADGIPERDQPAVWQAFLEARHCWWSMAVRRVVLPWAKPTRACE